MKKIPKTVNEEIQIKSFIHYSLERAEMNFKRQYWGHKFNLLMLNRHSRNYLFPGN